MERKRKKSLPKRFVTAMRKNWQLYLRHFTMVLLFGFAYMPMGGLVIAFKRYNFKDGIWGSPWIDPIFKNFEILFKNTSAALQAIRNTVLLNLLFISVGTIFALALSLAFNEIQNKYLKKITQSFSFLPTFISNCCSRNFCIGSSWI